MPKAAKPKANTAKSNSNPLNARSPNATKKSAAWKGSKETPSSSNRDPNPASALRRNASPGEDTHTPGTPPTATKPGDDRNYLLHTMNVLTSNPMITRLLSVPPSLTFGQLHEALQVAFGWAGCHMHSFRVEIENPSQSRKASLPEEVLTLQSAEHIDELGRKTVDENKWTLRDVIEKEEWEGKPVASKADIHITYEYDMGDGWEHQIQLLGRAEKGLHAALTGLPEEKAQKVLCVSGEGHPCAEDCGSEPGWEELKKAFTKPKGDRELKEWYKNVCANGDRKGLDPWKWDLMDVNAALENIKP
ncbi:MAG: hypothetical protein Q9208_008740 [Pyrenodesmia sp. 3 TL-2023]